MAGEPSGALETSKQSPGVPPRPTRPRSWCNCETPKRSASMMTIIEALGTSTPTSITVVATSTSISPAAKAFIAASLSSVDNFPCSGATFKPDNAPIASCGANSSTLVILTPPASSSLAVSSPIKRAIAISASVIFTFESASSLGKIRGATT